MTHRLLPLVQGSPEWHAWRAETPAGKRPIGGSLVPHILGIPAFRTQPDGHNSRQGQRIEPLVLARLSTILLAQGAIPSPFAPACVESTAHPERRGSLDGASFEGTTLHATAEIKLVCRGQWDRWRDGHGWKVPEAERAQGLWYQDITGVPHWFGTLLCSDYQPPSDGLALLAACGALHIEVLSPEDTTDERAAIIATVEAWEAAGYPDPAITAIEHPDAPALLSGTLDDGRLLATYHATRQTRDEICARLDLVRDRIKSRLLDSPGMEAGGYIATLDRRGTLRVRETR